MGDQQWVSPFTARLLIWNMMQDTTTHPKISLKPSISRRLEEIWTDLFMTRMLCSISTIEQGSWLRVLLDVINYINSNGGLTLINPTGKDIHTRRVYYKKDWMQPGQYEYGFITGFNAKYVFVRYGSNTQSQSTRREDLYWDQSVDRKWPKKRISLCPRLRISQNRLSISIFRKECMGN